MLMSSLTYLVICLGAIFLLSVVLVLLCLVWCTWYVHVFFAPFCHSFRLAIGKQLCKFCAAFVQGSILESKSTRRAGGQWDILLFLRWVCVVWGVVGVSPCHCLVLAVFQFGLIVWITFSLCSSLSFILGGGGSEEKLPDPFLSPWVGLWHLTSACAS